MEKRIKILAIAITIIFVLISNISCSKQENRPATKYLDVTNIEIIKIKTVINSDIVWVPGKSNSIAALYSHSEKETEDTSTYHKEDSLIEYNLETQESIELYNLWDFGISQINGRNFFWSSNGEKMITNAGGIIDVSKNLGYWIRLPDNFLDIQIYGISPDGKKVFFNGKTDEKFGTYIVDLDTEETIEFYPDISNFFPPLKAPPWKTAFYPLSWSPNGEWLLVATYDPENIPQSVTDTVPSALYMISIDGMKGQLVLREIDGNIIYGAFSPDGLKIIWVVEYENQDQSIFIANIDGSGAHEIFSNAGLSYEYNIMSRVLWSPDGNRLVFVGSHDKDYVYPFCVLTLDEREH